METLEAVRLFADGRMSMHDIRDLLVSMGHSREAIAQAFVTLSGAGSIRVGRAERDEYHAELYLTA